MIWLADLRNWRGQSSLHENTVSLVARLIQEDSLKMKSYSIDIKSLHSIQIFVWGMVTRWAMRRTVCSVCSRSYVCETICSCYFWTDRNYDHSLFRYFLLSVQQFTIFFTIYQCGKIYLKLSCLKTAPSCLAVLWQIFWLNFKCTEYLMKAFLGLFI